MSRFVEAQANLEQLLDLRTRLGLDALVLSRHANLAWAGAGGRTFVSTGHDAGAASLVMTDQATVLLTTNIEGPRLMTEELAGLPLRLVTYPWWEGPGAALAELLPAGARVGVDIPTAGVAAAAIVEPELQRLRSSLPPGAQDRARTAGQLVGQAIAAVAREVQQGETESAIAGRLTGALSARGLDVPVCLVAADQRVFAWRHFLPTENRLERYACLVVCGRKDGLIISATRLVHFGAPPADVMRRLAAVQRIDAELIAATRPGAAASELFELARSTYAATGFADEWQNHHQGGLAGYEEREWTATPSTAETVKAWQIYAWNPSVPGAKSEDTILVGENGSEMLTDAGDFPYDQITTSSGVIVRRPAILIR